MVLLPVELVLELQPGLPVQTQVRLMLSHFEVGLVEVRDAVSGELVPDSVAVEHLRFSAIRAALLGLVLSDGFMPDPQAMGVLDSVLRNMPN